MDTGIFVSNEVAYAIIGFVVLIYLSKSNWLSEIKWGKVSAKFGKKSDDDQSITKKDEPDAKDDRQDRGSSNEQSP